MKTYKPGEAFGELSLLYNAPRAASIRAKCDCTYFALDRASFNHEVKDAAMKKRERYEKFLSTVSLLSTMDSYERSKIADVLISKEFKAGDKIIC